MKRFLKIFDWFCWFAIVGAFLYYAGHLYLAFERGSIARVVTQ